MECIPLWEFLALQTWRPLSFVFEALCHFWVANELKAVSSVADFNMGVFTNYVYKTRFVGGPKMSTFCLRLYHRKCQRRGVGGQKKLKSCQRMNSPYLFLVSLNILVMKTNTIFKTSLWIIQKKITPFLSKVIRQWRQSQKDSIKNVLTSQTSEPTVKY